MTTASRLTRDEIEKQNRVLLKALQTAHPVLHNGLKRFIHTLVYTTAGGGIETDVYLMGKAEPVPPHELTPDPHHGKTGML